MSTEDGPEKKTIAMQNNYQNKGKVFSPET